MSRPPQDSDVTSPLIQSPPLIEPAEVTRTSVAFSTRDLPSAMSIEVTAGPDAGTSLTVPARPLIVGSGEACDLVLTDPTVSRRHLRVRAVGSEVLVRDLGSRFGTWIAGVQVTEAAVAPGCVFNVGRSTLTARATHVNDLPIASMDESFGPLLGKSLAMRQLFALLADLAPSDEPVLIEGERGTGKRATAEAMHAMSARARAPFIAFDPMAVASEAHRMALFGDAADRTPGGEFASAMGGTLYVSEIGCLNAAAQAEIAAALDPRKSRRRSSPNVRVIVATRRDPDRQMVRRHFDPDLFRRVAAKRVLVPSLAARTGDVPMLARAFAEEISAETIAPVMAMLATMDDYDWPGNVRELREVVHRVAVSAGDATASDGDVIEAVMRRGLTYTSARDAVLDAFNVRYVTEMLARHGGNVSRAAEAAGIARRYFQQIKARGK